MSATTAVQPRPLRGSALLVLAGIVVVAFNLRAAITVVGPLVPTMREDLGVDNVAIGAIGTLPVLAFGVAAMLAARIGRRVGIGRTLAGSMAVLTVGTLLRSVGTYPWLVVGTVLLGVGIGVANVLGPALIKKAFPTRVGTLTSVYGALMVVGATVSAALAVPVAEASGWEVSLVVWALPAAIATVVVLVSVLVDDRAATPEQRAADAAARRADGGIPASAMHRSAVAWWVTAFMGLQSTLFYVTLAWLPDVFVERGMSDARAGVLISVLNVAGLVGVLVAPAWAARYRDQRLFGAGTGSLTVLGLVLLLPTGTALAVPAVVFFGLGAGATVGLVFAFFSLRTTTVTEAAALSGMAQTWGFLVSAFGPVVWGAIRDASSSWTPALLALLAISVWTTVAGWQAGRDRVLQVTG